ncbi:MAG: thioredoxin-dependent thiol peroxidase [Leptospiraceae bacterium]|nr:thioredoxin-dependent thiol peroxidase [Leptospiraceae bacterium]MCK6381785.1 thioredoxin-dependent thiol peroxidase [Leptospiraceae bacterium]NUM41645.1 thioredoxin-dependent thiol peroxidase [Leptospiraceae bacterium]
MGELKIGEKILSFSFTDEEGKSKDINSILGKKGIVLYFYPRDMTPGCTTEACDFRDNFGDIKKLGFSIAGVSGDSEASHQKFKDKYELPFILISDKDYNICKRFGVYRDKKFMGKVSKGIVRTTILLDKDLKILKVYDEVKVKSHVANIKNDIMELVK